MSSLSSRSELGNVIRVERAVETMVYKPVFVLFILSGLVFEGLSRSTHEVRSEIPVFVGTFCWNVTFVGLDKTVKKAWDVCSLKRVVLQTRGVLRHSLCLERDFWQFCFKSNKGILHETTVTLQIKSELKKKKKTYDLDLANSQEFRRTTLFYLEE